MQQLTFKNDKYSRISITNSRKDNQKARAETEYQEKKKMQHMTDTD